MKVALVGLGMVAGTHVRAIADSDGLELVALHARDGTKARAFAAKVAARRDGVAPRVHDGLEALASDPDIDFVILCTPPNARADIVEVLVDAGKPILMEKPVERDLGAAEAIVERCERAGVPLGIVLQHRLRPVVAHLRRALAEGVLGELAVLEMAVPWWRPQAYYDEPGRGSYARDGGGVLINQAIHSIDLTLSLVGPVARVQAMARTSALHAMEAEDHVSAGLEFANGAIGSLVASTANFPGGPESVTLHGTEGSALLRAGRLEIRTRDGEVQALGEEGDTGGGADPMAFTHAWHRSVIEDFAVSLGERRAPAISGRDALAAHRLIDAITRSSTSGTIVEVATEPARGQRA